MTQQKTFFLTWLTLACLTLLSASFAESAEPSKIALFFVCLVTIYKGKLVIDNFMDLRNAVHRLRWLMLAYFYILLPIIFLTILFPETLLRLTTL